MEITLTIIGICVIFSLIFFLVLMFRQNQLSRTQSQSQTTQILEIMQTHQNNSVARIYDTNTALTREISHTTANVRQEITDRLHEFQIRVMEQLAEAQKSQQGVLIQNTRDLEGKFKTLQDSVRSNLDGIAQEVRNKLDKNIEEGFLQFQKVQETLLGAQKQLEGLNSVGQSIFELNNVLNLPHLRGKIIGEGCLERLLADFLPQGYFALQYSIEGKQVDAVVKFPHIDLVLPIDSKFSLEQVSGLFESGGVTENLKAARKKLSDILKQNAKDIKSKYIKPKLGTTDYALMFLPSETLYFEAVRDTETWNSIVTMKVFPVSPNTLAIAINSIGKSLHYYEMAKGVQQTILQLQRAKDHLCNFKDRFDEVGDRLTKAQDSYSRASTHLSNYSASVDKLPVSEQLIEKKNPTIESA